MGNSDAGLGHRRVEPVEGGLSKEKREEIELRSKMAEANTRQREAITRLQEQLEEEKQKRIRACEMLDEAIQFGVSFNFPPQQVLDGWKKFRGLS